MEGKRTVCGPGMEGKWETIGDLGKGQKGHRKIATITSRLSRTTTEI